MDGIHDLGGTDGMGSIQNTEDKQYFYHRWEEQVFVMAFAAMLKGLFNGDEMRYAIERIDPVSYLDTPYYEHWLMGMEKLLVEKSIFSKEEIQSRLEEVKSSENPDEIIPTKENQELTEELLELVEHGASAMRESVEPAFEQGDEVIVKNIHPEGHTRCPEYVRRAQGVINTVHGTFTFPDAHAHGGGESPQPLYSIRFDNDELWGSEYSGEDVSVCVDLWESYLKKTENQS